MTGVAKHEPTRCHMGCFGVQCLFALVLASPPLAAQATDSSGNWASSPLFRFASARQAEEFGYRLLARHMDNGLVVYP